MNATKTKTMVITRKDQTPEINIEIDGCKIAQVKEFVYLGQTITDDGRCDKAIRKRIEIARSAFNGFGKTLTSRDISIPTKLRLVKCYVWSTLLYGCETWTLSQQIMKKLQAFEMWIYRKMLKISWSDKKTNEEVLKNA